MIFTSDDIQVHDDGITVEEQNLIAVQFSAAMWRYGWPRSDAYFARPCWHIFIAGARRPEGECCASELAVNPEWGFLASVWSRIKELHIPDAILLGVYANGQTLGQDSPIHRDNKPQERGKTVVLFCNSHWASCWGGELVFYDHQKMNVIKSVLPRSGRFVVFNGQVPHSARSPSVACDQLRVTIAFKTVF
ncbi:2OG-Fe(II) oxygenase [Pseudomonas sp. TE3610]